MFCIQTHPHSNCPLLKGHALSEDFGMYFPLHRVAQNSCRYLCVLDVIGELSSVILECYLSRTLLLLYPTGIELCLVLSARVELAVYLTAENLYTFIGM